MIDFIHSDTVRQAAQGRWRDVLAALGAPSEYLTGKHSPCPSCGGKDRYRFTNWQDNGGFICNQCTPDGGSGFDLLMLLTGCGFAEAVRQVAAVLGLHGGEVLRFPLCSELRKAAPKPIKDNLDRLHRLLDESRPIALHDPVTGYLHNRGITLSPATLPRLNHHPNMTYWHDGESLEQHPAMIGAIRDLSGSLQGLHITYLHQDPNHGGTWLKAVLNTPDGAPLPSKKMRNRFSGSLKGCAVQLYEHGERLAIAEGIENALAAHEVTGYPSWAALSAHGMASLNIPPDVQELLIIADADLVGLSAAQTLSRRAIKQGATVRIWQPENEHGNDLADLLKASKTP